MLHKINVIAEVIIALAMATSPFWGSWVYYFHTGKLLSFN